jgi:hypothetical protein
MGGSFARASSSKSSTTVVKNQKASETSLTTAPKPSIRTSHPLHASILASTAPQHHRLHAFVQAHKLLSKHSRLVVRQAVVKNQQKHKPSYKQQHQLAAFVHQVVSKISKVKNQQTIVKNNKSAKMVIKNQQQKTFRCSV